MQIKKILIGMPLGEGTIPFETDAVLKSMFVPDGYVTQTMHVSGSVVSKARNIIIQHAIDNGFDYVLFLDDDNPPEQLDFLEKMLVADKDIVCGLIRTRGQPYRLCVWDKIINESGGPEYVNYTQIMKINNGLEPIQIHACGTGCVLIKREVFTKMSEIYQGSWYEYKLTTYLKTSDGKFTEYLALNHDKLQYPDLEGGVIKFHRSVLSEDILACDRATFHGFKIHCLPYVTCGHISKQIIGVGEEAFIYG